MLKRLLLALSLILAPGLAIAAPNAVVSYSVATCDPSYATRCIKPNVDGSLNVSGTITASLGGFQPTAGNTAALSATTTSSDTALPASSAIAVSNTGSVNAFVRLTTGAGTAVTTDQVVPAGTTIGFSVGTNTHISAITASGSTSISVQGGTGLVTGYGGGSSGSSGGAVFGPTADGGTAANPPVLVGGTNDGTGTGTVGVAKVSTSGLVSVDGSAVTQPISGTVAISGNPAVNVAQVNGVTTLTGAGATGTGSQRTTVAQDTTTIAGSAPGTAGTPSANIVTVQGATSGGTPLPVSATALSAATPVSSTALEANHIIKASAGTLYSFEVQADSTLSAAAWWVMIYNATSAPADGAVTPFKCFAVQAGSSQIGGTYATGGIALSTGITIGASTTGCFTKTASAHAFISGDFQ